MFENWFHLSIEGLDDLNEDIDIIRIEDAIIDELRVRTTTNIDTVVYYLLSLLIKGKSKDGIVMDSELSPWIEVLYTKLNRYIDTDKTGAILTPRTLDLAMYMRSELAYICRFNRLLIEDWLYQPWDFTRTIWFRLHRYQFMDRRTYIDLLFRVSEPSIRTSGTTIKLWRTLFEEPLELDEWFFTLIPRFVARLHLVMNGIDPALADRIVPLVLINIKPRKHPDNYECNVWRNAINRLNLWKWMEPT